MQAAGVDFVLPDYWGEPGQYARRVAPAPELNLFATAGHPADGRRRCSSSTPEGRPLKIGLFLDTTILNDEDLTTERGKQIFYAIDPRLLLADPAAPLGGHRRPAGRSGCTTRSGSARSTKSTFDYVYAALRAGLRRPAALHRARGPVVHRACADQSRDPDRRPYGWGAAVFGYNPDPRYTIAQVGPGFNNTQLRATVRTASTSTAATAPSSSAPGAGAAPGRQHPGGRDLERARRRLGHPRDAGVRPPVHRHPAQLCRSAQRARVACRMKSWLAGSSIDCNPTYRNSTPSSRRGPAFAAS